MKGGISENMSHWKGQDWLKEVSSSSPHPPTPAAYVLCAIFTAMLLPQHQNTTFTCREDGDCSFQTESTCLSSYTCLPREQ